MAEKEQRSFNIEFHSAPDSRRIEGRAIPFNIQSPNREGFREMIVPEAVEGVIEKSDILMLYNHSNEGGFLARNNKGKGSLEISVKEDGVYFAFDAGNDNLSNYILERIQRGELDETSFAFTIESDEWTKAPDGVYDRKITKFDQLYDFSVVDRSYYGISNAVKCARYAEVLQEEKEENERKMAELAKAEEERQAEEARQKEAEIAEYYKQIREANADYLKK